MNQSDKIRAKLESWGCKYIPNRTMYYFELNLEAIQSQGNLVYVFFLDALYCALNTPDPKVRLRAYIQACEYSVDTNRYLRYHWEEAFYDAKQLVEGAFT
jgi:hypothetical protein